MPLVALTPVLNDLLNKEGGGSSSFSQQQRASLNDVSNIADGLRKPSCVSNRLSLSSANEDPHQSRVSVLGSNEALRRNDSFLTRFSNRHGNRGFGVMDPTKKSLHLIVEKEEPIKSGYAFIRQILRACNYFVISTDESFLFYWLILLNIFVLYNLWFVIARQAFDQLQQEYAELWAIVDYIADIIYFIDIVIQFRTGYLEQGLLVYNHYRLAMNYIRSSRFACDVLSLVPFGMLRIKLGSIPMLRFSRFFKVYRTFQLYYLQESRTVYPNTYRVLNLIHILLLLGHWLASFYFMVSKAEGFAGYWSYPKPVGNFSQLTKMYLRCLYWSTLTLTTIGDLPPPETNWQWLKTFTNKRASFAIVSYMVGIFVYSSIIGQVGNVITNRNASRLEFERLLDGAKQYMRSRNVPSDMQRRVQRWYDYSWSRGRISGAGDVHSIKLLPDKLKTELALHVNLGTLEKVTIFQECQPEFLHDLVLKMRASIFTPGDIICRKGEVAREMFIVADGVLEVVNEKNDVLTRLGAGDFFGEIGILNIDGANRRTADVRSVGYSELFSLSKEDVLEGCRDYPEAERKLYEYAQHRLGVEKARNEAAEKAQGALNTSTSVASDLINHPLTTVPMPIDVAQTKLSDEENDLLMNNSYNEDISKCDQACYMNNQPISLVHEPNIQNETGNDNDQCALLTDQDSISKCLSLTKSLPTHSNELINEIELLISHKISSIEQNYRQQIAELQEFISRKNLRIQLLEEKLQMLQRTLLDRNRTWLEDE